MRVDPMPALLREQKGQTMIEMIVVIFVISVGLLTILSLSTANLQNQANGANRLVASNLAREGVELVRNIRDTNWVAGNTWDAGLTGSTHCATVANDLVSLNFSGVDCVSALIPGYPLYRNETAGNAYGVYSSDSSLKPTPFYRRIKLDPICLVGGVESIATGSTTCASPDQKIGIQITSEVASITNPNPVRFIEQVYNWR